jgi:dTDP-glucose pyrophosphorylase
MISASVMPLLSALAASDRRAAEIADVICRLIKDGRDLGSLEIARVRSIDGVVRECIVMPSEWVPRLARAVEVGAFERMEVKDIVARILMPLESAA